MIPKSLGVPTIPSPKCQYHRRFTITRAGSGFAGSVSQFASAVRRPVVAAPAVIFAGPGASR